MYKQIGSHEAKTKLPEILRRVEAGEAFTITNRGKPIGDVIPSHSGDPLKVDVAIANILKAKKHVITDEQLDELRNSGPK